MPVNVNVHPPCKTTTVQSLGEDFYSGGFGNFNTQPPFVRISQVQGQSGTIDLTSESNLNYPLVNDAQRLFAAIGVADPCPHLNEVIEYQISTDTTGEILPAAKWTSPSGTNAGDGDII